MTFRCLDCGNKSSKQFPGGKCPACDSYNVSTTKTKSTKKDRSQARKKVDLLILVTCWGALAYLLADKLL